MNILYVSMTRREKLLGCAVMLPLLLDLPFFWEAAISFTAVVIIFRRFLLESLRVPLTTPFQIILKAVLGLIVSYVATIFVNDLFYFYLPEYFAYTDFGPMYYNVNEAALTALVQENFLPTALAFVVLMPVAEEVLFRGLLFGSIFRYSRILAYVVSVGVFALLPVLPLLGHYPTAYLVLNFLQYVPLGLVLGWVYTSTETIVTPIVLRMALHALAICSMR